MLTDARKKFIKNEPFYVIEIKPQRTPAALEEVEDAIEQERTRYEEVRYASEQKRPIIVLRDLRARFPEVIAKTLDFIGFETVIEFDGSDRNSAKAARKLLATYFNPLYAQRLARKALGSHRVRMYHAIEGRDNYPERPKPLRTGTYLDPEMMRGPKFKRMPQESDVLDSIVRTAALRTDARPIELESPRRRLHPHQSSRSSYVHRSGSYRR